MSEKYIRCPVHGYIQLNPIETSLIDTQLFQRLRNIHQQGTAYYTYPGATHSRFEHSLGVMHLASQVFDILHSKNEDFWGKDYKKIKQLLRLEALFHDIGHGPFSHVSDRILAQCMSEGQVAELKERDLEAHEFIAYKIMEQKIPLYLSEIKDLCGPNYDYFCNNLANGFVGDQIIDYQKGEKVEVDYGYVLNKIIDSKIDCDKMDFLMRDAHLIGIESGKIDISRLIRTYNFNCEDHTIFFDRQSLSSIEDIIIKRYQEYRWVNFHHSVCFTDEIMARIIELGIDEKIIDKKLFTLDHFFEICNTDLENQHGHTDNMNTEILDDRFIMFKIRQINSQDTSKNKLKQYANIIERRHFYKPLWKVNSKLNIDDIIILNKLKEVLNNENKKKVKLSDSIKVKIEENIKERLKVPDAIITFKPYEPIHLNLGNYIQIKTEFGMQLIKDLSYIINKISPISPNINEVPPLNIPIYSFIDKQITEEERRTGREQVLEIINDQLPQ